MKEKETDHYHLDTKDGTVRFTMEILIMFSKDLLDRPDFDVVEYVAEQARSSARRFMEKEKEGLEQFVKEA